MDPRFHPGVLAMAACIAPATGQVCNPRELQDAYGFQFSGTTTISGQPQPVVSLGRLEFDAAGEVSGTAWVNFAGYLLGNPVTGTYKLAEDCSIVWSLQDDSGAFQHFSGVFGPDLLRAPFHQSDRGGPGAGTLVKLASACSTAELAGTYRFAISGNTTPMETGQTAEIISLSGTVTADTSGDLTAVRNGSTVLVGTAAVDPDCIVQVTFRPSSDATVNLRGILAPDREILAIQTDAGTAVKASFHPFTP
jgi:hypothetical protein